MKKVFVVINDKVENSDVVGFLKTLASVIENNKNVIGIQTLSEDISVSFIDSFPKKFSNQIISINLNNKILNGFSFAYGDALEKIKDLSIKLELDRDNIGQLPKEQKEIYDIIAEVHDIYLFDFNNTSKEEVEEAIKENKEEGYTNVVLAINKPEFTSTKDLDVINIEVDKDFSKVHEILKTKLFNENKRMG